MIRIAGADLPELINKMISHCEVAEFLDDGSRILSFGEIMHADTDLHVDFKGKGILPLIDCGENDFIVFHFEKKIWSKFNIVDECEFQVKDCLEDLLA